MRVSIISVARSFSGLVVVFFAGVMVGCGGGAGPGDAVSGKVTLDGQAVAGSVVFIGADSKEVAAPIRPDGRYTVPNPPAGQVRVLVRGLPQPTLPRGAPPMKDAPSPKGATPPAKYGSLRTSQLTFDVTGGKQTFDITLTP